MNQEWAHPVLDWLVATTASPKLTAPLMVGLVLWLLLGAGIKGKTLLVLALLNIGLGDAFINQTIRKIVKRPRPHEALVGTRRAEWRNNAPFIRFTKNINQNPGGKSLPSGHVMNNVSVGICAMWLFPQARMAIVAWILIIGFGRVYSGAHYPSDVLISGWIALLYSLFFCLLTEWLWRSWFAKEGRPASLIFGAEAEVNTTQ